MARQVLRNDLVQAYPKVSVELVLTDRFVELIDERMDVVVRIGVPRDSDLIMRKLAEARRRSQTRFGVPDCGTVWLRTLPQFNSLDAQREACEAFVRSQRHEGWIILPQLYDDAGYSGGTMERPAPGRRHAPLGSVGLEPEDDTEGERQIWVNATVGAPAAVVAAPGRIAVMTGSLGTTLGRLRFEGRSPFRENGRLTLRSEAAIGRRNTARGL